MLASIMALVATAQQPSAAPTATCIQARNDFSGVATKPIDYLIGNLYGLATPIAVLLFVACLIAGMALVRSQKAAGWFKAAGTVALIILLIPLGAALLYKISASAPALC